MVEFLLQGDTLAGAGLRFRAAIGRSGISTQKSEGDGATPAGVMRLVRVLYRADRVKAPACAAPVEPIGPLDGWCDDADDTAYNMPVCLPYPAHHEALWRPDHIYDVIGVLDWNLHPIVKGGGSAIFFHVAASGYSPTAGCVALALPDVLAALCAGLSAIRVPD